MIVRPTPPEPPVIAVPPITTAAMLGRSRLSAIVGLPPYGRDRGSVSPQSRPQADWVHRKRRQW
jgi:hypothetical protein